MDLVRHLDIDPSTIELVDLYYLHVSLTEAESIAERMRLEWSDRLAADTTQDKGWAHCADADLG